MNNINIFKIECKCVFTGSDRKIYNCKTIYEDQQVVINNFETALDKYNYMLEKCQAIGYSKYYDFFVSIKHCKIAYTGEICGDKIILIHEKGDKHYLQRRIIPKINVELFPYDFYGLYDTKNEKFITKDDNYNLQYYAFEDAWECLKAIANEKELKILNHKNKYERR